MSTIKVNGETYPVIFQFDVLWSGWECDSDAWVVETDGGLALVMTNHGSKYFADTSELKERISSYENTIENTNKALGMLLK